MTNYAIGQAQTPTGLPVWVVCCHVLGGWTSLRICSERIDAEEILDLLQRGVITAVQAPEWPTSSAPEAVGERVETVADIHRSRRRRR